MFPLPTEVVCTWGWTVCGAGAVISLEPSRRITMEMLLPAACNKHITLSSNRLRHFIIETKKKWKKKLFLHIELYEGVYSPLFTTEIIGPFSFELATKTYM